MWYKVIIEWKGNIPTQTQCDILTEAIRNVTINFPEIKIHGVDASQGDPEAFWLDPITTIDIPINLLHFAGFPCSGTMKSAERKHPKHQYPEPILSRDDFPLTDVDKELFMEIWSEALENS